MIPDKNGLISQLYKFIGMVLWKHAFGRENCSIIQYKTRQADLTVYLDGYSLLFSVGS